MLTFMTTPADVKDIFASLAGRRVTAQDMADILETSRNTVNLRLKNGLAAEDVIAISRGLNINPVDALVELEKLTRDEVFNYLDGDAKLLATASIEELVYRLAEDTLSNIEKIELGGAARSLLERDDLAARRVGAPVSGPSASLPDDDDGVVREFDYEPGEYAADSSINEQEEREKRGEDLID
nr:MAG TPA: helix-turn-helix, Psq domain [Caudoviricetes sp.]